MRFLVLLLVIIIIIALCLSGNTYSISGGNESNKEIFLIRHAQTDFNSKNMWYDNHTKEDDIDINKIGVEQAIQTGKYLAKYKPDLIVASSRKRTIHTAEIIAKEIGYKGKIIKTDLLFEPTKGVFNHKTHDEIDEILKLSEQNTQVENKYKIDDPIERLSKIHEYYTESDAVWEKEFKTSGKIDQFRNYETFIKWLVNRKEQRIFIVGHSGTIKALQALMLGLYPPNVPKDPPTDEFGNCTVTYLQYGHISPITNTYNKMPRFYLISKENNGHLENN